MFTYTDCQMSCCLQNFCKVNTINIVLQIQKILYQRLNECIRVSPSKDHAITFVFCSEIIKNNNSNYHLIFFFFSFPISSFLVEWQQVKITLFKTKIRFPSPCDFRCQELRNKHPKMHDKLVKYGSGTTKKFSCEHSISEKDKRVFSP